MPRGKRTEEDTTMLSMALVGYELEKQKIEAKIAELRSLLGGRPISPAASVAKRTNAAYAETPSNNGRKRRTLSPAARKRIAAAQKKRWAEHRKKQAAGE